MSNNIHVEIQNASVILLPETELAGTVLSYTVKSFQANIWVSPAAKKNRLNISKIFQVVLGGTFTDWYRVLWMGTENSNKHSFPPKENIEKPSWEQSQEG